jgi:hypothetical protein
MVITAGTVLITTSSCWPTWSHRATKSPRAQFHSSYQLARRYSENMAPLNNGAPETHTITA